MGFELGPGFQRKPPKGWLPARAHPLKHAAYEPRGDSHGSAEIATVAVLDAVWDVRIEGREPYELTDENRSAPVWCIRNTMHGKRWYNVRLRGSHGLLRDVGVPCFVDPTNRTKLWIDWDRAYEEHTEAWNRAERIDREIGRRKGGIHSVIGRVDNPFAEKIRDDEAHLVDQEIAAREAREAAQLDQSRRLHAEQQAAKGITAETQDEWNRRNAEMERIYASGRPAQATVVSNEDSGGTLNSIPVILITLDVHDGGAARRICLEHVWGPRHAKRYKPGKRVDVRVDPANPDLIALA